MRVGRLYPGLLPFQTDHSDLFFGRETEISELMASIAQDPVVVVVGPSGCGKSSLIKAGIMPRLLASQRLVLYTPVIENVIQDVQHTIRRVYGAEKAPENFVDALLALYSSPYPRPEGVDGRESQTAAVRKLIRDAFGPGDLERFCRDRPTFEPVLTRFGPRFSLEEMIDALIDYCVQRILLRELLSEVRQANPRQFNRHRDRLERTGLSLGTLTSPKPVDENVPPVQPRHKQPIVLILDQFEQALLPSHPTEALETFFKGISRLMSEPVRCATVVIVVRADWLYYLQNSVRNFYSRLNVYSIVFTVDPLGERTARAAIKGPLEAYGIPYDKAVLDEIVACLQRTAMGPMAGSYIQPIQLQMVIRALCDLAESRGVPQEVFTEENLRLSGGVESILRNYFAHSVGKRSEAWRLLARFVAQEGTGRTIRRSELLSIPAAQEVERELGFLLNQGFLETYEVEGSGDVYLRLAHDYLVNEVADYLSRNQDQLGWKQAEDWLASGTLEWQESVKKDGQDGFLLEEHRYLQIYDYRDKLDLSEESAKLLTLTALRYGHEGLGYWISRSSDWESDIQALTDKLLSPEPDVQSAARAALSRSLEETGQALGKRERVLLRTNVQGAMSSPKTSEQRDAAARALWALREFDSARERLRIGTVVAQRWSRDHAGRIASYAITVFLVILLVTAALYVRHRLQGTWQTIETLKAGPIPLVVVDPTDSETIYALSVGGSTPREGTSLYMQQEGEWVRLSRDFAKGQPVSLVAVPNEPMPNFYTAFYGLGMIRSVDGGQSWQVINRGLPSHALTALVADPDEPRTLYVATGDFRGVLRSSDGGDSWDWYDHRGEIFGTAIGKLVYARAEGGMLVAGTGDGRILFHRRHSSDWELGSAWSKGSASTLVVGESDERIVYAGTNRGIVLLSENGGETWVVMGQVANQISITTMAIDPADSSHLYAATYGNGGYTLWKSIDSGQTWETLPGVGLARTPIRSLLVLVQGSRRLVAGTVQGLFSSYDDGATWQQEPLDVPLASIRGLTLSARHAAPVYALVRGSVYSNLEGHLETWTMGQGLLAEEVRTVVVDPDDPLVAYAGVRLTGEWSVFVTRDGGRTWASTQAPALAPLVPDTTALALAKTRQGRTVLYAGTVGCGVLRSLDEGNSWETYGREHCHESQDPQMPTDVSFLAVDSLSSDGVYAATGQTFFHSEDGGYTWQGEEPGIQSPILGLASDPTEAKVVYLITGSDGFWRSEDGGRTWQKPHGQPFQGTELTCIVAVPGRPGSLIVGSANGGIWTTSTGGERWQSIRQNLSVSHISAIATSAALDGRILVGTPGDGMALFVPGALFGSQDVRDGDKK